MKTETLPVKKCRAIVMFGPPSETMGTRPATFYQVTLDPCLVSPSGDFIRLGSNEGDEIHGWQAVSGLTVCEVLGEYNEDGDYPGSDMKPEPLEMAHLV